MFRTCSLFKTSMAIFALIVALAPLSCAAPATAPAAEVPTESVVEVEPIGIWSEPSAGALLLHGAVVRIRVPEKWVSADLRWILTPVGENTSLPDPPGELIQTNSSTWTYTAPQQGSGDVAIVVSGQIEGLEGNDRIEFTIK